MAVVYKRIVKDKDGKAHETDSYYFDVWVGGHHRQRCARTGDKRKALDERRRFLERLENEAHELEALARKVGCDPVDVVYCVGCGRPMNKIFAVFADGGKFCSKTCLEKWREEQEVVHIPALREFQTRFFQSVETRNADHPETIAFYRQKFARLLEFSPLGDARLDRIDEALIESYIEHRRSTVSIGSTNRELATLRKVLRLAQEWHIINRVPRIRLLPGEKPREFVLSYEREREYLQRAPQPLRDFAILSVDCGLRAGEGLTLQWPDVHLEPDESKYGYVHIRKGKSRNAKRDIPLTERVKTMLESRKAESKSLWVFTDASGQEHCSVSTIDHQHQPVREAMGLGKEFVIHSLRHTYGTRLGQAGADAFTIMKLMGHSTVVVSQKYVHPVPEQIALAVDRLQTLNEIKRASLPPVAQTATNDLSKTTALATRHEVRDLQVL